MNTRASIVCYSHDLLEPCKHCGGSVLMDFYLPDDQRIDPGHEWEGVIGCRDCGIRTDWMPIHSSEIGGIDWAKVDDLIAIWERCTFADGVAARAREQALLNAAKAVEQHDKAGRGWIKGSLWDSLTCEAAARIRALLAVESGLGVHAASEAAKSLDPIPAMDSKAKISGGALVIRIPLETLVFAARNSEYFSRATETAEALVITDQSNFAQSVVRSLNVESEDGSTPVTRMLDKAFVWVVEQGEEGFELAAKGSTP